MKRMVLKVAQFLRNLHREEEGFTLIELLIVIAIIAVIAAIAIPMVASRIDDARESADRANVRTLQGLVDQYYIDKGVYPVEGLTKVTGDVYDGEGDAYRANGTDEWLELLIEEKLLHDEGVANPYPGDENCYYLIVKEGAKTDTWVGTVTSSTADRWKEADTEG
jgi:prepilin-type N-terminal cleavage/methylation domain-containing protein